MGVLRLFLAILVLASHTNIMLFSGVMAVECFFIISGFFIQMIILEHYSGQPGWISRFYESRLLRIFVPYWIILLSIIILSQVLKRPAELPELQALAAPDALFVNLFIVGSEYAKLIRIATADCKVPLWDVMFIKAAWSIALELTFYALAPFLLTRFYAILGIMAASMAMKIWFLHTNWDTMTFLSCWDGFLSTIFLQEIGFFLAGALLYRFYARYLRHNTAFAANKFYILLITVLMFSVFALRKIFSLPDPAMIAGYYAYVVLIACLCPFLFAASRGRKLDRMLGELSYPFYLLHYFILCQVRFLGWNRNFTFALALLLTLAGAYLIMRYVEKPLTQLRHRLFRKQEN